MILKAEQILVYLREGDKPKTKDPFVISPSPNWTELEDSGAASIDIRLGTWFVSLKQARLSHLKITSDGYQSQLTKTHYVRYGSEYILHPRCFVLGITLEWIRITNKLAGYVVGKSSLGRRGLIIATATGIHPGYTGCLTLELTNVGEIPIAIKPGMKICQLFFHEVRGGSENIDCSQFVGLRKPELGKIEVDDMAEALGDFHVAKL